MKHLDSAAVSNKKWHKQQRPRDQIVNCECSGRPLAYVSHKADISEVVGSSAFPNSEIARKKKNKRPFGDLSLLSNLERRQHSMCPDGG